MDEEIRKAVTHLHGTDDMAVIAVTGAGFKAVDWLLSIPGASRTLLESVIPYSTQSLVNLIGCMPDKFVSDDTAIAMAKAAYHRAASLHESGGRVFGVGCTATIATDRPKKGEHRCHVAICHALGLLNYSVTLKKGMRDREGEEDLVSRLIIRALCESTGVDNNVELPASESENILTKSTAYMDAIESLCGGHVASVIIKPGGKGASDKLSNCGILSGSFNPLHGAHRGLAEAARRLLSNDVVFELSVTNVDKPELLEEQVRLRAEQFLSDDTLILTRAPTFHEKAVLFPGCIFIVGWDTAQRLVDPRYYQQNEANMLNALKYIRKLDCRFLVAGRENQGLFCTLEDISLPNGFDDLFLTIDESDFRSDLSSSELRLIDQTP